MMRVLTLLTTYLTTDDVSNVVLYPLGSLLTGAGLVGLDGGEQAANLFQEPGVLTVNGVRLVIVSHLATTNIYFYLI